MSAGAKLGRREALALARGASTLIVSRGIRTVSFAMSKDRPDDKTLLAHMLGPTGNLRAPTIRKGKTLLVGFSDEAYQRLL